MFSICYDKTSHTAVLEQTLYQEETLIDDISEQENQMLWYSNYFFDSCLFISPHFCVLCIVASSSAQASFYLCEI